MDTRTGSYTSADFTWRGIAVVIDSYSERDTGYGEDIVREARWDNVDEYLDYAVDGDLPWPRKRPVAGALVPRYILEAVEAHDDFVQCAGEASRGW